MLQSEVGDVTIQTFLVDEAADRWVTLVRGGKMDNYQRTYDNEADAQAGHEAVTQQVVEVEGKQQTG